MIRSREPVDMAELENAAFELSRQFDRLARELCQREDIHGVAFAVTQINSIHRMAHHAKQRFSK